MTTFIAFHEVDDVDHWLSSTVRAEIFATIGVKVRTFVDPEKSNRTGVMLDVPDVAKFQELMASDAAAEAMKHDGVRADTLVTLVEA